VAQAAFAVRWAANYGNGACIKDVYRRYVWQDKVVPGAARTWTNQSDNGYANKLGIGMEIVHKGDGSPLAPDVFELACQINAAAEDVYGWKKNQSRIIGHEDSTRRKIDPKFAQGSPYTMSAIRSRVAAIQGGSGPTPPEVDEVFLPVVEGDGMGAKTAKKSDVSVVQRLLNDHPNVNPKLTTDGMYGSATRKAVKQVFPNETGTQVGGQQYYKLQKVAFG
jgi:hypothetical protein